MVHDKRDKGIGTDCVLMLLLSSICPNLCLWRRARQPRLLVFPCAKPCTLAPCHPFISSLSPSLLHSPKDVQVIQREARELFKFRVNVKHQPIKIVNVLSRDRTLVP
jgi:hypothetical protein